MSAPDLARVSDDVQAQDFDCPFTLAADGTVTGGASGPDVFAPSVFHDEESDVWIDGAGWEPLTGMTGQYGYHGAVMHASEVIGGSTGIVRRMLEYVTDAGEPQTFVIVSVEVMTEDHAGMTGDECPACGEDPSEWDECYPEPAGWAILHYVGTDSDRLVLPDGTASTPCEYSHRDRGAISARGVVWLAMIVGCLAFWATVIYALLRAGGAL